MVVRFYISLIPAPIPRKGLTRERASEARQPNHIDVLLVEISALRENTHCRSFSSTTYGGKIVEVVGALCKIRLKSHKTEKGGFTARNE